MPWKKQFDIDEVLEKAMTAFWHRGYAATSMQDLVTCTGVNRASLYATYGGKRDLFIAALKAYDESGRQVLFARLEALDDPREAIHRLFLANAALASGPGELRGCFMTNTALELAQHDKEIGAIVAGVQEEMEAFFRRMIELGKKEKSIAPDVDARITARALLASLLGLLVLVRSRPDKALLASIVRDAMHRLHSA